MGDASKSPLAMLVLVTPYTILYLVNQLFLNGILDKMHYVFFELIFVLAFRKIFGLPDLSERLFPAQAAIHSTETVRPLKTSVASAGGELVVKKKIKKVVHKAPASTAPKKAKEQPYAKELVAMEKKFMDYLENTEIWEKVFEETSPSLIEVYQYKARPMCYKIIAVMDSTPGATIDFLSDVGRRVEWDPLCVEAKTITTVSAGVKIQYVRTKAMWPTASRDTLVLGTVKKLAEDTYFNVTSSVEHHLMPERTQEKIVRMDTALAAQLVGPEPGQPQKCRLIQVLDTDLKGWIPDKIIQLVSTKAVPAGMRKVNKMLQKMEPYDAPQILERIAAERKAEEAAVENGEDDEAEEPSHELRSQRSATTLSSTPSLSDQHASGNNKLFNHGTVEKKRPSTFRIFWEGVRQNLGYGSVPGKANKVLIMTLVLAVLGPTIARYRRRR